MRVGAETRIDASREEVWDVLCDHEHWIDWVAMTDAYTSFSGPVGKAMTYTERTRVGPVSLPSRWEVVEFSPPRRQVHAGRMLGLRGSLSIDVEEPGAGSLVRFTVTSAVPLAELLVGAIIRRGLSDTLIALKSRIDGPAGGSVTTF